MGTDTAANLGMCPKEFNRKLPEERRGHPRVTAPFHPAPTPFQTPPDERQAPPPPPLNHPDPGFPQSSAVPPLARFPRSTLVCRIDPSQQHTTYNS